MPLVASACPAVAEALALAAPRRSSATWRPSAATCCSARAAPISAMPPRRLQQARARHGLRGDRRRHRMHAVLGTSDACIATLPRRPRDGAGRPRRRGRDRTARRRTRSRDRRVLPAAGRQPERRDRARARRADHRDRASRPPRSPRARPTSRSATAQSYAFALASAAVALELDDGTVRDARIALGGVAHRAVARARGRGQRSRAVRSMRVLPMRAGELAIARRTDHAGQRLQGAAGQRRPCRGPD